ncbi:MAG: tRNA lysidine(34) synthetase TilS [Bacteroidota bacterium]
MLEQFRGFIDENALLPDKGKVVLAVSGGVDSVVMTDLFNQNQIPCIIAHCNFQLRGQESDDDEDFVRSLAARYGYEVKVRKFEVNQKAGQNNQSVQMMARDLRFKWFDELLEEPGLEVVATGHHFDDQVETFFINLLRGTGVSGLRGMLARQGKVIHPLLFATREQIEEYARQRGLPFREDQTNKTLKYQRNQIRHILMPALEKIAPDYRNPFGKTFRYLHHNEIMLKRLVSRTMSEISQYEGEVVYVNKSQLQNIPDKEYIMPYWLQQYGFHEDIARRLLESLPGLSGKQFFSPSHRITVDREYLILEPHYEKADDQKYYIYPETGSVTSPISLVFKRQPNDDNFVFTKASEVALLDYNKLEFPLEIRRWQHGDAFMPLGMNGMKKVSDFFTDIKLSVPGKEKAWLLFSANGDLVWVMGHRIDHRYRITGETSEILKIELFEKPNVK